MVAHGAWDDPDENTIKSIKVISSSSAVTLQWNTMKPLQPPNTIVYIYIYSQNQTLKHGKNKSKFSIRKHLDLGIADASTRAIVLPGDFHVVVLDWTGNHRWFQLKGHFVLGRSSSYFTSPGKEKIGCPRSEKTSTSAGFWWLFDGWPLLSDLLEWGSQHISQISSPIRLEHLWNQPKNEKKWP